MDIIKRRIKSVVPIFQTLREVEKTYEAITTNYTTTYKIGISLIVLSLMMYIVPHQAYAVETEPVVLLDRQLVFEAGDQSQYLDKVEAAASKEFEHEAVVAKLKRQLRLAEALKNYLHYQGSPLAEYASTIIQQNNWKKIIALSNAESSLCKKYIEATANCWGVGGADLWDMGENLGEGVIEMNKFLNNSPRQSSIKYTQMNFEQMNGLYKQPAAQHWVNNNLQVYNELTALEKSVR